MKSKTFIHPDHTHRYELIEESLHYEKGTRWVLKQLNENGRGGYDYLQTQSDVLLDKSQLENALSQFEQQGWKELLLG